MELVHYDGVVNQCLDQLPVDLLHFVHSLQSTAVIVETVGCQVLLHDWSQSRHSDPGYRWSHVVVELSAPVGEAWKEDHPSV